NTTSTLNKRWQYAANGNATLIDANLTRQLYTYDFIDRLTVERASANFTYTYDGNDNRTTKTSNGALTNYEYTPQTNQLTSAGSQSITKDKAGNITGDGAMQYTWNNRNRLHTATQDENTKARYEYDHTGFRTQKHTGDDVHIYHYDQTGRRVQHDINGKVSTTTLWIGWMPVAHLQHDSQGRIDSITWLTTDHLGTPRLGTNNTGQTVWRWTGDAFGTVQPNSDPDSNGTHIYIENRFAGQYRDKETGLHYNGFRHYSPTIGRYMSSDPIGLAGGMNTYGYAEGNPLMYYDFLGLSAESASIFDIAENIYDSIVESLEYGYDASLSAYDFGDAFFDMMKATVWDRPDGKWGWVAQDLYFHCRANCRAAQRGPGGEDASQCLSDAREEYFGGSSSSFSGNKPDPKQQALDSAKDVVANNFGRKQGGENPSGD
ncbi:MAG: hypothetical protein K8963_05200, partial [Proteobacteria bacterium]|nr:hypothetical protein [Pseudomonadota bacterium]